MARLLRHTGTVFVLMLLARGSGFVRNLLLVNKMNVGVDSDAFFVAIAVVDFVILLSGLNAMKSVATTTFTRERNSHADTSAYLSSLLYGITAYGLLLSIPLLIAPGFLTRIFAPGFGPAAVRVTSLCVRIVAVLVLFKGLLPIFEALLGVRGRFAAQNMFIPVINAVAICVILFSPAERLLPRFAAVFTVCFALSCVGSYLFVAERSSHLVAVQFDVLKRQVRRFAGLAYPLLFATTAYTVAEVADKIIASFFERGVITSLGIAYSLCFMTIGVLLDPVWRVLFPHFSKLYVEKRHERLGRLFNDGQYAVAMMFIPVAIFFAFFGRDVILAVFLAKKISPEHIDTAARILSIYGIALIFNAGFFLPSYLLQSAQKNACVGRAAAIAFSANVLCSITFSLRWGYVGIPLGTVVSYIAYVILLAAGIRRHLGISLEPRLTRGAAAAVAASVVGVFAARSIAVPPLAFAGLGDYIYPIVNCAARLLIYTAVSLSLIALLQGKRIIALFRQGF